jgi:hypothetical protein
MDEAVEADHGNRNRLDQRDGHMAKARVEGIYRSPTEPFIYAKVGKGYYLVRCFMLSGDGKKILPASPDKEIDSGDLPQAAAVKDPTKLVKLF